MIDALTSSWVVHIIMIIRSYSVKILESKNMSSNYEF